MSVKSIQYAPYVFHRLRGVICIYKPRDTTIHKTLLILRSNLKKDLQKIPNYGYERRALKEKIARLQSVENEQSGSSVGDIIATPGAVVPNPEDNTMTPDVTYNRFSVLPAPEGMPLSKHRLVLGNRYSVGDFKMDVIHPLSETSSGVMLISIGKGRNMYSKIIKDANYIRVYHVSGKFGYMADDFTDKGRLLQRTTYNHITKPKLEKICSYSQNMHQKYMFEYAGVSPDSQEAYDLAVKGMIRPAGEDTPPILYGIRCIEFEPPDFTLEIHSINENCDYLCRLVHDIGLHLKSSAVTTKVRRIRYGFFNLDHSLAFTQWRYDSLMSNVKLCRSLLTPQNLLMTNTLTVPQEDCTQEHDRYLQGEKRTKFLESVDSKVNAHEEEITRSQQHIEITQTSESSNTCDSDDKNNEVI